MTLDTETATALYRMMLKTDYPVWTKEQIKEHLDKGFIFKSRYINNLRQKSLSPDPESQDFHLAPPDQEEGFALETSNNYDNQNRGYNTNYDNRNRGRGTNYDDRNRGYGMDDRNRGYNPNNDWNESTYGLNRALANLTKMYTEKLQYGGNNNNFDQKLKVFHDLCNRTGIPRIARNQAFPTMLRDIALDHYYDNFDSNQQPKPLNKLCSAFRNYFEGPEYRRRRLALWESLTIETIIKKPKNNDKSTYECLRLLISELRILQHGLDPELRTEKLLRNKLISAYQTLPACQYAYYKPAENLSSLIEDFQSSM